jgi:hypothetical protein
LVEQEEYTEAGTRIVGRVPRVLAGRFGEFAGSESV